MLAGQDRIVEGSVIQSGLAVAGGVAYHQAFFFVIPGSQQCGAGSIFASVFLGQDDGSESEQSLLFPFCHDCRTVCGRDDRYITQTAGCFKSLADSGKSFLFWKRGDPAVYFF